MKVGAGDGRVGGSGPYTKAHTQQWPFEGAVYTVAGSSSKTDPVSSMPCMVASLSTLGSLVLDFNGNRLDAQDNGVVVVIDNDHRESGAMQPALPADPIPFGGNEIGGPDIHRALREGVGIELAVEQRVGLGGVCSFFRNSQPARV